MNRCGAFVVAFAAVTLAAAGRPAAADPPCTALGGACPTPSSGPDVVVGELVGISRWGTIDGISAYSIGTTSCNIGDWVLSWDADTPLHPVIAQNMYRLKDGRFEQIGMSWLKHGFAALTGNLCCTCINPNNSQFLGVGCSDPYSANLNGDQDGTGCCGGLGPRYQVNAETGAFAFPYDSLGMAGNAIYKRLQVRLDDLDPALNPGAKYYGEGHYVAPDDSDAANHHNNASYTRFVVGNFQNGSWILLFTGDTTRGCPAIYAWQEEDPDVVIEVIEDDNDPGDDHDGRFYLGHRVTDNGDGTWHYEYALYNMNSNRSAKSFTVPVDPLATISNIGFHDVDYHSGDGVSGVTTSGTDWTVTQQCGQVTWATENYSTDVNANALRWGTLYNFRFDADAPPVDVTTTINLFKPGVVPQVFTANQGPGPPVCPWDADDDDQVGISEFLEILGRWGEPECGPPDFDGDGNIGIEDFLLVLGHWGPCPTDDACGPGAGSCTTANGTAGCSDLECCGTVCAVEPLCCDVEWDASCGGLALTLCGNCGDAGAGDCCSANGTPGCDEAACCASVCEADPLCCTSQWDVICALQAETSCGCP